MALPSSVVDLLSDSGEEEHGDAAAALLTCDSSDDEDIPTWKPYAACNNKSVTDEAPPRVSLSPRNEINLCDSSDDDDEITKPSAKPNQPSKILVHPSTMAGKPRITTTVADPYANKLTISTDSVPPFAGAPEPRTTAIDNPYAKLIPPHFSIRNREAPSKSSALRSRCAGDDSDDDLMEYMECGLAIAKSPQAPGMQKPTLTLITLTDDAHQVVQLSLNQRTEGRPQVALLSPKISTPFPYPSPLSRTMTYKDERARFALSFWKYSKSFVRDSYGRPQLDILAKRVVKLALSEHPVRSLEEYVCLGKSSVADGRQVRNELREQLDQGKLDDWETPSVHGSSGRFYTISEACLVAMLDQIEAQMKVGGRDPANLEAGVLCQKDFWVALAVLIPVIDELPMPVCPGRLSHHDEAYYMDRDTKSAEFLQITKLECELGDKLGPRIKQHMKNRKVFFELLPAGYKSAVMIRGRQFPSIPGHYRCSRITASEEVEEEYRGICLAVDLREGGGGHNVLHGMCNTLDTKKVPYFVGSLSIGDYIFFTTKDGGTTQGSLDYLCPILVERKSIQDVAQSIHDDRWQNQKSRMYIGQFVFGYGKCRMVYIIEGNENKQTLTGGFVGNRSFNVDRERLNREIENLKAEGFEVLQSCSRKNSMLELARWAQRVVKEMREGKLKAEYTYAEFKAKCAEIPRGTDFSRLASVTYKKIKRRKTMPSDRQAMKTTLTLKSFLTASQGRRLHRRLRKLPND